MNPDKDLPEKCPNCKKKTEYEYGDINIEDHQAWQKITCSLCEAKFVEFYELAGWEQL